MSSFTLSRSSTWIYLQYLLQWRNNLSEKEMEALAGIRITVVPDWICEIISPSSLRMDKIIKAEKYAQSGIPYYWILNPEVRTLEVMKLERRRWVMLGTFEGKETVKAEPFKNVAIHLSALWGPIKN